MVKNTLRTLSLLCFSRLLAISAFAQCKDRLCQNLQNILYAAVTDFREYRANRSAAPDNKQEMCTYLSRESVVLHITMWK